MIAGKASTLAWDPGWSDVYKRQTYMTLNNPFFSIIDEEIHNVVEANGDVLISLDPALDLEKQKQQIQYLIDQNVQAIIVNPVDFNGLTSSLEAAKKAGIPVIAVDSEVMDSDLITYSVIDVYKRQC